MLIYPKVSNNTPAQFEVYWKEFYRLQAIQSRSIRLERIKQYDIQFEVEDGMLCVYLKGKLVICVPTKRGTEDTIDSCLFTLYKVLGVLDGDGYLFIR